MDFDGLAALSSDDLVRMAGLLESGILAPPLNPLNLRAHIAAERTESVACELEGLAGRGMRLGHIALVIRAFAAGRSSVRNGADIDVVVTGPDATDSVRDTSVVVRQLFSRAEKRVLATGFAIHQGKSVFKALADRMDADNAINATLCIDIRRRRGDTSPDGVIVRRFAKEFVRKEWPGERHPDVYYDPRSLTVSSWKGSAMHAKCVVIDKREALVTSANFTEAAQERNIELGLLVNFGSAARQIDEHFLSLIQKRHLKRLPLPR